MSPTKPNLDRNRADVFATAVVAAEVAEPLFTQNGWKWTGPNGVRFIPDRDDIHAKYCDLVRSIEASWESDNFDDWTYAIGSGRLTVRCSYGEAGDVDFEFGVSTGSFQTEPPL